MPAVLVECDMAKEKKMDVVKPVPAAPVLSVPDAALMTVFLIHEYAAAKGKPVTRFRMPKDALWRSAMAEGPRQKLIAAWKETLATEYGWLVFDTPKHFALIQAPLVQGWVLLGGKRFAETRQKIREGDETVLAAMREAVAPAKKAAA